MARSTETDSKSTNGCMRQTIDPNLEAPNPSIAKETASENGKNLNLSTDESTKLPQKRAQ